MKQLKISVDSEFASTDIKKTHEDDHEAIFVLTVSKKQKEKRKRYVFEEIEESEAIRTFSDNEYILINNPSFSVMRLLDDTNHDFSIVKLVKTEEINE